MSRRQHKKPALLSSITRNQRRGGKDDPEGSHTPSKSSREALIEIKLEIDPVDLPEQPSRDTRSDIIVKTFLRNSYKFCRNTRFRLIWKAIIWESVQKRSYTKIIWGFMQQAHI